MPINFYQVTNSAPCRAFALAAAAVGVEMNFKHVDVMKGDQLKPEYVKMNPQRIKPTIDDNGLYLWKKLQPSKIPGDYSGFGRVIIERSREIIARCVIPTVNTHQVFQGRPDPLATNDVEIAFCNFH